jgi:hypothetical protein
MLPELIEASYLSRFFAKFTEIIAAGLATAMCAYLISYLGVGGPLSSASPAPAAVSAAPAAGEVAASVPAQVAPPLAAPPLAAAAVAASAVDEQRRAPQPVTDAPPAQPVRKAEKAAPAAPKDLKTGTSMAREKSVEALARAALANVDADRPAPVDAPNRRTWAGTRSAASAAIEAQQRPADVPPRQADIPPPPAAFEAQPRRVAAVAPLLPSAGAPPEIAAPQPEPQADQHKGLFSFLKRGTPSFAGEAPRPPMPVGAGE